MPLSDSKIKELIQEKQMIRSAALEQQRDGQISWGLSSSGYDFRLDYRVRVITYPNWQKIYSKETMPNDWIGDPNCLPEESIDPKDINPEYFADVLIPDGKVFILGPYQYFLGNTIEYLSLPENIVVNFLGKSTLVRCGLLINLTPGEAGWGGYLTVEGFNATPRPLVLYPGEGICQGQFYEIDGDVEVPYHLRDGKYHNQQKMPTLARL